jgi:hypothetical protein
MTLLRRQAHFRCAERELLSHRYAFATAVYAALLYRVDGAPMGFGNGARLSHLLLAWGVDLRLAAVSFRDDDSASSMVRYLCRVRDRAAGPAASW